MKTTRKMQRTIRMKKERGRKERVKMTRMRRKKQIIRWKKSKNLNENQWKTSRLNWKVAGMVN